MLIECLGQRDDLIAGKITVTLLFRFLVHPCRRIVGKPAPSLRQIEHAAQESNCAVDNRRAANSRDVMVKSIHVGVCNSSKLFSSQCGNTILAQMARSSVCDLAA